MGEERLNAGKLYFDTGDGYTEIAEIKDIETYTEDPQEVDMIELPSIANGYSCEMTFKVSRNMKRLLNMLVWGWKASGPIRKRTLRKVIMDRRRKRHEKD